MTDVDLQAIRDRCNRASPGPWSCAPWNTLPNGYLYGPEPLHQHKPDPPGLMRAYPPVSLRYEDADFCANARTDLVILLEEVDRLQRQLVERVVSGQPTSP